MLNVAPPNIPVRIHLVQIIVQTFLSEIFKDDFSSLDLIVGSFNCAVLAAPIAVIVKINLLAVRAFPEHIVRSHQHFRP